MYHEPERQTIYQNGKIMSNITCLFFCFFAVGMVNGPVTDRERLEIIEDDTPLTRAADKPAWDYLFDILRRSSQAELGKTVFAEVGFVELSRQPKEYRGRLVSVRGKLLRCNFISERREPSPFGESERPKPAGFYESWVLLKDEKRIPIAVCSLKVPENFPLGNELNEQVELVGFFYKRQLFLSAEGEEVTTPTLLAKTFRWFPDTKKEKETVSPKSTRWIDQYFWSILIVLGTTWFTLRTLSRQAAKKLPLFLAVLLGVMPTGFAQESPKIDAEFTKMLLQMDDFAWNALGDEHIPLAQQQEDVFAMMHELRTAVPLSFLKRGAKDTPPGFPENLRGQAFRLKGTVTLVEELPLNPVQRKAFQLPMFFCCRLNLPEDAAQNAPHRAQRLNLLTPTVPVAWKRNEPIRENAAAVGIYIKRLPSSETPGDYGGVPPSSPAPYDLFDDPPTPLFVIPDIEWYPDTLPGNLGMNVAALDRIPVLRIADLKKKTLDVAEPLRLLSRSEIVRRAFKFTEADREPFYGLLKATKNLAGTPAPLGTVTLSSAVPLFTEPDKHRNELIQLHGTAKRVIPTLVEDKEVQELYGITKYYQIYFYTKDSQGNPLVACATQLPKGMPVGSDADYSEQISITGFFYKLWVYDSSAVIEKEGKEGEFHKPTFAPLLIGRKPDWYPAKHIAKAPDGGHWTTTLSFTTFGCLAVLWYVLCRLRSTKPIVFKLHR